MVLDMLLHISFSFMIVMLFYLFDTSIKTSLTTAIIIGLTKEVYDYISYGVFSFKDIAFDFVGIIAGVILILWIEKDRREYG